MEKLLNGLLTILLGLGLLVGVSALWALPVEWLWNYAVADGLMSGSHQIDFWHAWALLTLCNFLFKNTTTTTTTTSK